MRPLSISLAGQSYEIPSLAEESSSFEEIRRRAEDCRRQGASVVVVQGLGYVGLAVAAVAASRRNSDGSPRFFVIGVDLPTPGAYFKIAEVNAGVCPVESPDPALVHMIQEGALQRRNLCATSCESAFSVADTIIVDIPLDARRSDENKDVIEVNLSGFEQGIRSIGRNMRPDALVLVETTVPVGACEHVVIPALSQELSARGISEPPIVAHSYERVMPGPRYTDSIKRFWRTFSAASDEGSRRARKFLEALVDTHEFPLSELKSTSASELAKVLENSYRAVNIALLYEWTLLAEELGLDLFAIVDSIRVRKGTHDNMRYPGFGVGGYCLTKDSLLAKWGAQTFFDAHPSLEFSLRALEVNERMPLHAFDLLEEVCSGTLTGKHILIAGVAYLPDLDDTRSSPALVLAKALTAAGALVTAHDPVVKSWDEMPGISFTNDLPSALAAADGAVWCVQHGAYRELSSAQLTVRADKGVGFVDANNVFSDALASELAGRGIRLAGVGKGHWRAKRYHQERSCP